jgi:hypothetical protein
MFILVINTHTKGSKTEKTIEQFLKNFEDNSNTQDIVFQCEKQANCDVLCDKTIQFGEFTNEFIMGDIYILDRANAFLDKLTEGEYNKGRNNINSWNINNPVDGIINENVWDPKSGDKIKSNWINDNIINIIT